MDEEQAKFELQTTVLNENLTTIRGDMVTAQQQVEELSKSNDELRGEKLGKISSKNKNSISEYACNIDEILFFLYTSIYPVYLKRTS